MEVGVFLFRITFLGFCLHEQATGLWLKVIPYVGINSKKYPFGFLLSDVSKFKSSLMCAFYDQRTTFYSHIGINIFFAIWRQFLFGHPNRPVRPPEQSALFGFSEVPEPEPEQKNRPIGRYKTATEWPNRAIRRTDVQNSLFGSLFSLQNHNLNVEAQSKQVSSPFSFQQSIMHISPSSSLNE